MGTYWHSLQRQKDADRRKRHICKHKNVILLEIWENIDSDNWLNEVIRQLEDQTDIRFTKEQFSKFRNFLGNLKKTQSE